MGVGRSGWAWVLKIIPASERGLGGSSVKGGKIATGKALAMTDKNATATPRNDEVV